MVLAPRLFVALALGVALSGCAPRAKPTTYQLEVESYDPDVAVPVQVTFTGTVTVDGERKAVGPFTTPWTGKWVGLSFGAELRTEDPAGMRATLTYEEPPVPQLTVRNRSKGPYGCVIRVVERRHETAQGVNILAMEIPAPAPAGTPAATR
jgi:hypothetical protein